MANARPSPQPVRTRGMMLAVALTASLVVAACGSSTSPVAGGGSTTTVAATAGTTAPTTATSAPASTTTVPVATTPTTSPASAAGAAEYCTAVRKVASSLLTNGRALTSLGSSSKPSAAVIDELQSIANDFKGLVVAAPPAIKADVEQAAHIYGELASAFRTRDLSKVRAAISGFSASNTPQDLLNIQEFELKHCALH